MTTLTLTRLRESRGLSKARLARLADLDQALVGKIESGRVRPYPGQLVKLARVLGMKDAVSMTLLEPAGGATNAP